MEQWAYWVTNHTKKPFYLRREFVLPEKPVSATVKVCGLGQFNLSLNGEQVGDHVLDPGWTDYNKVVQYLTFDVTEGLREGTNAFGMEVGNGWYLWDQEVGYSFHFPPFMPPNPNPYRPYGESLVAALELTVRFADGRCDRLVRDGAWRTAPHPVL